MISIDKPIYPTCENLTFLLLLNNVIYFLIELTQNVIVNLSLITRFLFKTGHFQPMGGKFTITANVGDSVNLGVIVNGNPPVGLSASRDIRWQKQSDTSAGFRTFTDNSNTTFNINPVTVDDSGVYATYWEEKRTDFRFSLIRLIVRGMP